MLFRSHGGIIATILDEVMSWTAIHLIKSIIVTRTMTVEFLKPVFIGRQLTADARVLCNLCPPIVIYDDRLSLKTRCYA